jgi:hypothetical protein
MTAQFPISFLLFLHAFIRHLDSHNSFFVQCFADSSNQRDLQPELTKDDPVQPVHVVKFNSVLNIIRESKGRKSSMLLC